MNLYHDFVQVSKLSENQKNETPPKMEHFFPQIQVKTKKRSSPKMEHFFPRIQVNTYTLRCTPESNYWGGCICRLYSNYLGDTVKLLGGISPRVSAPLGRTIGRNEFL